MVIASFFSTVRTYTLKTRGVESVKGQRIKLYFFPIKCSDALVARDTGEIEESLLQSVDGDKKIHFDRLLLAREMLLTRRQAGRQAGRQKRTLQ